MRTSITQFEVMIGFMERNGDLNKPHDGPHGRLFAINKWLDLTNALNLDTTGTAKPVDKWKKVWSDLKNNTKRKASKIHRSVGGTGGGPAIKLILTDLELRILSIIGPQAATGLVNVEEVGLELVSPPQPSTASTGGFLPETSSHQSPTPFQVQVEVESIVEDRNRPDGSNQSTPFPTEVVAAGAASPTTHHAQSPLRPRRVMRGRRRSTQTSVGPAASQRTRQPSQRQYVDAASAQFLNTDEQWHRLATLFVNENQRLRAVEIEQQARWQNLFAKFLELLNTVINK